MKDLELKFVLDFIPIDSNGRVIGLFMYDEYDDNSDNIFTLQKHGKIFKLCINNEYLSLDSEKEYMNTSIKKGYIIIPSIFNFENTHLSSADHILRYEVKSIIWDERKNSFYEKEIFINFISKHDEFIIKNFNLNFKDYINNKSNILMDPEKYIKEKNKNNINIIENKSSEEVSNLFISTYLED